MKQERKKILYAITYFIVQEKDYERDDELDGIDPSVDDEIDAILICLPEILSMEDVKFAEKLIATKRFISGTDDFLERVRITTYEPKEELLDASAFESTLI